MKIKAELLKTYISDFVNSRIEDFERIEEIVCVFEKHKIDFGNCHDF